MVVYDDGLPSGGNHLDKRQAVNDERAHRPDDFRRAKRKSMECPQYSDLDLGLSYKPLEEASGNLSA